MNEIVSHTNSPAPEDAKASLPEPHFDDKSVELAQPVEPIARVETVYPGLEFGTLIRYLSTKAALIIAVAMVTLAGVALVSAGLYRRSMVAEPEAAIRPLEQQPVAQEPSDPSELVMRESSAPRSKQRTTRVQIRTDSSRPVARRVGVIVY